MDNLDGKKPGERLYVEAGDEQALVTWGTTLGSSLILFARDDKIKGWLHHGWSPGRVHVRSFRIGAVSIAFEREVDIAVLHKDDGFPNGHQFVLVTRDADDLELELWGERRLPVRLVDKDWASWVL